jgi:hypothetical protein
MGLIAETLATRIAESGARSDRSRRRRRDPVFDLASAPGATEFVRQGLSPLHARYAAAQHIAAAFAEYAIEFPVLASFLDAAQAAEADYLPSGPPMSPLTTSYFTTWMLFDLRFGPDAETLSDCLLRVVPGFSVEPDLVEALGRLASSRMGVFVHEGHEDDGLVRLRELVTHDLVLCEVPAGRRGEAGELWFARVCPPLTGIAARHLVLTTPYVLVESSRADWSAYLHRALRDMPGGDERARLHELLKFGRTPRAWPEFVMNAYHHHQRDAVFLAGIPDVPGSLPHA